MGARSPLASWHPLIALMAVTFVPAVLPAQVATDIFLVEVQESEGRLAAGRVVRVTDRAGYDNQPGFLPDGTSLLFTSIDSAGQADIFRYDIEAMRSTPLTRSAPESEYSATVMPSGDRFSAIRVESDSTQRLWSFRLDGSDPRILLEEVKPVGYHAWIDASRVALFVLGDPPTLEIADVATGKVSTVAERIGRSIQPVPGRKAISFVQREGDGPGAVLLYDPATNMTEPLATEVEENEYHAWTPSGILLSARGSKLLQWSGSAGWTDVADLAHAGLREISRIATSPDGKLIALVSSQ
jgi:Tol biopolymer transport system component